MDKKDIEVMILKALWDGRVKVVFKIPKATTIDDVQIYLFEEGLRKLFGLDEESER